MDLARVLRRFVDLRAKVTQVKFNRKELVNELGFGPNSGAANSVISALMHFGLLQRIETDYIYTDLGNRFALISPGTREYSTLLTEALRSPELYNWLDGKYGESLPEEINEILIGKYHDRGIKKENIKNIINNYLKSVSFTKNTPRHKDKGRELDEYISVSFMGNVVPIYKEYLREAIRKTREDELVKINESLG